MTGGRRGRCGAQTADTTGWGHVPGRGRGFRNQYYATGLTGWRRARVVAATPVPESRIDRIAELEARLDEALARLARLERTE